MKDIAWNITCGADIVVALPKQAHEAAGHHHLQWAAVLQAPQAPHRLRHAGLQFISEEKIVEKESDKFNGKTFVISGVFLKFSREELKEKIEANGGKIISSISAKLDYLVAGDNMGPAKLEKATKLGVKMISEEEFLMMLANS